MKKLLKVEKQLQEEKQLKAMYWAEKHLKEEKQLKAMLRSEFWAWLQFRYPNEWYRLMSEFTFSIRPSGYFTLKELEGLDIWHNKVYPERRLRLFVEWIVADRPPQFTKGEITDVDDIVDAVAFIMEQDSLS